MSFPDDTKCQVCGDKSTVVITSFTNKIKESYCEKHYQSSRSGFISPPSFVFLDKEGKEITNV